MVVGPSLDVCVHSEATQQWIVDSIFSASDGENDQDHTREPWRAPPCGQLERGILLHVEDGSSKSVEAKHNVTELLLYATVSSAPSAKIDLPTPTPSSPPSASRSISSEEILLTSAVCKIHALPLSWPFSNSAARIGSPLADDSNETRFLTPLAEDNTKPPRKRQNVSSLFEDAAQQRKQRKRRGGEGVSQAMATLDMAPTTCHTIDQLQATNFIKDLADPKPAARASLSRASSIVSAQAVEPSRPPSRREAFVNSKRSALHRVESISSPRETFCISDPDSSIVQQNKSALTKIVMAGMRVHGLQQRKRSNKAQGSDELPGGNSEAQAPSTLPEEDSEYKFVYHQTFKAAFFTFRLHIATTLITQEAMRDIVDRLLAIFCTDPLRHDGFGGTTCRGTETSSKTGNPFDLPSASAYIASSPPDRIAWLVEGNHQKAPRQLIG